MKLETNFIDEQIHRVAYQKCLENPHYKKVSSEVNRLLKTLRDSLKNKKEEKILLQLENAFNLEEAIFLEYAYLQGIEDSRVAQNFNTLNI